MTGIVGSKTEFLINGTWTDVTSRVRGADGISIYGRGLADQQGQVAAAVNAFTLNNRDGLYSNRNPLSVNYGLLPINTQVRHSVPLAVSDNWIKMSYPDASGTVSTADKAVLRVTGDLDIRMEITPDTWRPNGGYHLAGRYTPTGNQRSWTFWLNNDGQIVFTWSVDGTFGTNTSIGTGPGGYFVPATTGRLAVRATIDVDNGAAGNTVTLYTAPSLAGPWTARRTAVNAGVTSIFAGTSILEIGASNGIGGASLAGLSVFHGKIHGFEMYSGIAGTLVAKLDPTAKALGLASWSDGLGTPNTWTITGNARVTSDQVRYVGAMRNLPTTWDVSGTDVYKTIQALGPIDTITRKSAITSPVYRNFSRYNPAFYWPMEAESTATTPDSAGTSPSGATVNNISLTGATPAGLAGSAGSLILNAGGAGGSFVYFGGAKPPASTGTANFVFYFRLSALPASQVRVVTLGSNGTATGWTIDISATTYTFTAYAPDSSVVATSGAILFGAGASPLNQWIGMQLLLTTSGGTVTWQTLWHAVGTGVFYTHNPGGSTYAGAGGRFHSLRISAELDANLAGMQIAHPMMSQDIWTLNSTQFANTSSGWIGETAGARLARLAGEEGLALDLWGDPAATVTMGAQPIDTPWNIFQQAAVTDGGILGECRDAYQLEYRSFAWMGLALGQSIAYTSSLLATPPIVQDDDSFVLNDVTATSPTGSSRRSVVSTGPYSTQSPPSGVGTYPGFVAPNPQTDDQLQHIAERVSFQGTWDAPRVPNLTFEMMRSQMTAANLAPVSFLDQGTGIVVTAMPSYAGAPNGLDMLVLGYQEIIGQFLWTITFNTIPRGPYYNSRVSNPEDLPRLDTDDSTLNASATTTATSMTFKSSPNPFLIKWVDTTGYPAEFPFDVLITGEQITVTAMTTGAASGSDWLQTATVTRSVNGIVKAHNAGEKITLFTPAYLGV